MVFIAIVSGNEMNSFFRKKISIKFISRSSIAVLAALVFIQGCSKSITVFHPLCLAGSVLVNGSPLTVTDVLYPGDSIETGSSSAAYLRLDDKSYLVLYPESSISFLKKDPSKFSLSLVKGAVYLYSMDGRDKQLEAGSALYSADGKMRGWFYHEGEGSGVRLSAGEIDIRIKGIKNKLKIRPGFGIDVIGEKSASPCPLDQQMIDSLLYAEKISQSGSADAFSDKRLRENILSFRSSSLADSVSLRRLEMESGPLSIVTTKHGKVSTGIVSVQGSFIEIKTLKGMDRVVSKDVKSVSRYQFR